MSQKKEVSRPVEGLPYIRHDPEQGRILIDMANVEEPVRCFYAHAVRLDLDPDGSGGVIFSFGQFAPPRRLVGLLAIQLTKASFADFVETLNEDFTFHVRRASENSGGGFCDLTELEASEVPMERVAVLKAAVGRGSVGGTGAQIDWYDISARTIHAITKGYANAQGLAPIVTIAMSAGLMKRLIELVKAQGAARDEKGV